MKMAVNSVDWCGERKCLQRRPTRRAACHPGASLLLMGKVVCFPIKTVGVIVLQAINIKAIFRLFLRGKGWTLPANDCIGGFRRGQIDYAQVESGCSAAA